MVARVFKFNHSGRSDFMIQRATAMVLTPYTFLIMGFFLITPEINHAVLVTFFFNWPMQIANSLAMVAIVAHAWIGMWTIGTDYLLQAHVGKHANFIRSSYQSLCIVALCIYLVWAFRLVWQI